MGLLRWLLLPLLLVALAWPTPAYTDKPAYRLQELTKAHRLALLGPDGASTHVPLAGINIPLAFYEAAQKLLQAEAANQDLQLPPVKDEPALLLLPNGSSLQALLVQAGFARVFTTAASAALAPLLYPFEEQARAAKKGLWADASYAILDAHHISKAQTEQFQIVTGTVQSVARVGDTVYLNFGNAGDTANSNSWRTDFTIAMPRAIAVALDSASLVGTTVRVRGWLFNRNGPQLWLSHPTQLEYP